MATDHIARLSIALDEVKPEVLRRVEVPLTLSLDRLHVVIQAAMGWSNSHLFEFRVSGIAWCIPDPDGGSADTRDVQKTTLMQLLESAGGESFKYLYDFGDGWEHSIQLETIGAPEFNVAYPCLIDAARRCPPEDVGGPWGYAEYLKILIDPDHDQHDEMIAWGGSNFDSETVDANAIAKDFVKLAKCWSRSEQDRKTQIML